MDLAVEFAEGAGENWFWRLNKVALPNFVGVVSSKMEYGALRVPGVCCWTG